MEFGLFKKIVDELGSYKEFSVLELQMWGEPLMNPDIFRMIDYSMQRVGKVVVSTNAMLLDKRNREMLIKHPPSVFRISIDAVTKEVYGRIRCGGDFKKVVSNAKSFLKEKGKDQPPMSIAQLIEMKYNIQEIDDFKNEWKDLADDVWIIRLSSMGDLRRRFNSMKVRNYCQGWNQPCGTLWNRMSIPMAMSHSAGMT